jgi:hypothetical protein
MRTLLCCVPNPRDVTSFFRATGPIGQLINQPDADFNMLLGQEVYDEICYIAKGAFLQRPFTDEHFKIAKLVKRNRRRLWVDYDDDLFDLPSDNPAFDQYGDSKIRKNMAEIIAMADIVSVTTEALKKKLSFGPMKGKDIRVVPNAIDFERFDQTPKQIRQNVVLWRGSKTHQRDVLTVAKEINSLYEQSPNTIWEFLGDRQWIVTDSMIKKDPKRIIYHRGVDVVEYFQHIIDLAPKTFIAPLMDHAFNRAKSNIAFLEASFCGALCIAPKFEEWDVPGCVTYDPKYSEDFELKFKDVMSGKLDSQVEVARTWVRENRSLNKVNELRKQIVKEIMG